MRWSILRCIAAFAAVAILAGCAGPSQRPPESPDERAISVLTERLASDPGDRQARLELAYLYIRLKRWPGAVRHLGAALETDSSDPRLWMELGYARQAMGELDAASDAFVIAARSPGELQGQARAALAQLEIMRSPEARSIRQYAVLDQAYKALEAGRTQQAREGFESALIEDPGKALVHKQLGYMSIEEGDFRSAVTRFEGAYRLEPDDRRTALQLGYIHDGLRNPAKAEAAFLTALPSEDVKVRDAAEAALRSIQARRRRFYLDVYASPFYTARFSNRINFLEAKLGAKLHRDSPLSAYLGAQYSKDTKSRGGLEPKIYSDNVLLTGVGVRFEPEGLGVSLAAETNVASRLVHGPGESTAEPDHRVLFGAYRGWGARLMGDAGFSLGYYSRYRHNVIGYLQFREGARLWDRGGPVFIAYLPLNVIKDTNRDFYNNLVEFGAGLEFQPLPSRGMKARIEVIRRVYYGIEGVDPNPHGPHYNDVRVMLIHAQRFAR